MTQRFTIHSGYDIGYGLTPSRYVEYADGHSLYLFGSTPKTPTTVVMTEVSLEGGLSEG